MSQNTQQDSRPIAEAVDLPEISVEHSTEFLTGSAPCAGVSRPLPAAWLGQRGIYRSRLEAVCNGEQLVEPLTLGELIQRAWPSPSTELAERGTQHRFSTTEQTCRHDFAGVWWNDNGVTQTGHECRHCGFFVADVTEAPAEQAEAERPEVVAWRYGFSGGIVSDKACLDEWKSGGEYQSLMTVAQHERIVGELRAENERLANDRDRANQFANGAALEINAALARVAKLEHSQSFQRDIDYSVLSEYADKHRLHFNNLCAVVRSALIALPAQAQHSVPEGFIGRLSEFLAQRGATGKALLRELRDMLAAAPGKEVPQAWLDVQAERKRQVEAEGWTPEHDDEHDTGALASAAGCYAMFSLAYPAGDPSHFWPWDKSWWKPSPDGRRNMVKAGALILAEIERLDRVAASQGGPSDA